MYERLPREERCVSLCSIGNKNKAMDMDVDIYTVENEELHFLEQEKEMAVLLLEGGLSFSWDKEQAEGFRRNVFEDMPFCLHVPANTAIVCKAHGRARFLVQKAMNGNHFAPVLYKQEDFSEVRAGEGFMENTATRLIRTIFDYQSAPYSQMVLGEVIAQQGRWSSYPPHYHDQPEVYYYQFDKPQGFGCAMIGDAAYKIHDHSYIAIEGGYSHPQATAPGYKMYFCWMIKHLEGNPWKERIFEPEHEWMV